MLPSAQRLTVRLTIALFIIVAVLIVKPGGIFGRRVVSRV